MEELEGVGVREVGTIEVGWEGAIVDGRVVGRRLALARDGCYG